MRRFIKDESGIAMGLAVIVVVIVGVMGAGLLVFVQNDLEAVVETNQGQEAFEATDAGMQAAERQLLSDNCPEAYGGSVAAGEGCEPRGSSGEWHGGGGKDLEFGGRDIRVEITYLPFHEDDASCDDGEPLNLDEEDHPGCAPEEKQDKDERHFFKVESEGWSGEESDPGEARRIAEGVLYTYDLGVPKAYYSSSTEDDKPSIDVGGTAKIDGVSLFSRGDINVSGDAEITGKDLAYGDWENSYNETARPGGEDRAGIGTTEDITNGQEDGRDFDGGTTPPFEEDPGDGDLTFPFDPDAQSGEADQERIQFWREEAQRQDNYYEKSGNKDLDEWPEDSTDSTVVFVEFDGTKSNNQLNWNVGGEGGDCDGEEAKNNAKKGTLVVVGADFDPGGKKQALFSGVTVIRGGSLADGDFDGSGNFCLDGFVNADGQIDLNGTASSLATQSVVNRPGFYGVETWSWRELYQ